MFVLLAITAELLERLAVPIGIGLAVLLILLIPPLRRGIMNNYREGKEFRERLTRKRQEDKGRHEEDGRERKDCS